MPSVKLAKRFLRKVSHHLPMRYLQLSHNWQYKQRNATLSLEEDFASADGWLPATVPGTIHQDLLASGQIPDPFFGLNEPLVQWVGERDWLYRCEFVLPSFIDDENTIALRCDGLDTFATIWLNGTQVLVSDNMFVSHRVPLSSLLQPGRNVLHILFESALRRGKEREAHYGSLPVWNGDASRLYVRKAQYHYGWDWGPTLLSAGIWRPIRLEAYTVRIADMHCPAEVAPDLASARLPLSITLDGSSFSHLSLHIALYAPTGEAVEQITLPVAGPKVQRVLTVHHPDLWWPRGYGEQALYRLVVTLQDDGEILERREQRFGLRRLQLVQHPLADGSGDSFLFEINNTPVFCGGANWIPADLLVPRITSERYRAWLQLAADANMVMLRVWGGGIYEEDVFYDLCDELGLLVWQDFMFACGLYPAHEEFRESVRVEAEETVRRLRHHPCIALWCGNNEDYLVAGSQGAYDPTFEGDFTQTAFPARALYEQVLPQVCASLDPTRSYWPGSPYSGADNADANDTHIGDQHVWSVWHGTMEPYQEYPHLGGSFVSEFGMQAYPVMSTISSFTEPPERSPRSSTMDLHNKASGGPERLTSYLERNIRVPERLEEYVYATQLIQAEALAAAFRGWRRRWGGAGHEKTAGALVWQLNDCWPVTSWAIVDSLLRPKPAYYVVRRELAPFASGIAHLSEERAAIWAVNSLSVALEANLVVSTWLLDGTLLAQEHAQVVLAANQATELREVGSQASETHVLAVRLVKDGKVIARAALWPEPFKDLTLPDPEIAIEHLEHNALRVQVKRPAKGVWLSAADGVAWSDNMLDVFPDDPQVVIATGLGDTPVEVNWLKG
jgi:beta-mannosidase